MATVAGVWALAWLLSNFAVRPVPQEQLQLLIHPSDSRAAEVLLYGPMFLWLTIAGFPRPRSGLWCPRCRAMIDLRTVVCPACGYVPSLRREEQPWPPLWAWPQYPQPEPLDVPAPAAAEAGDPEAGGPEAAAPAEDPGSDRA